MAVPKYALEDRYRADHTESFLTGTQALAHLPIEQMLVDRRNSLDTATFVCGYPGSPLGGYDRAITEAARIRLNSPFITNQGSTRNMPPRR